MGRLVREELGQLCAARGRAPGPGSLNGTAGTLPDPAQASGGPTGPGAGQRRSGVRLEPAGVPVAELPFAASVISEQRFIH